jgi:hypothetical protein
MAPTEEAESIAAIGRQIADDAVHLVRDEISLAKAEIVRAIKALAWAIGFGAAAAACLLLLGVTFVGLLADLLSELLFHHEWLGWLVVGGLFLLLTLLFAWLAYRRVKRVMGTGKETIGNLKEDVEWLKHLTKRSGSEI